MKISGAENDAEDDDDKDDESVLILEICNKTLQVS